MARKDDVLVIELPLRIISTANAREHWAERARRVKSERALVELMIRAEARRGLAGILGRSPALSAMVTLTRIAPRALDSDNLQLAFKAIRDAISSFLGIDDREARIVWLYAQERGNPRQHGIRISIAIN